MSPRLLLPIVATLSAAAAFAANDDLHLNCNNANPVEPAVEAILIRQLGGGKVARVSEHVLAVEAGGTTLRFEDQPPFIQVTGLQHRFCDRRGGFVLLQTQESGDWQGVLVDEASGQVVAGGLEVILSPDRRAYFATRHLWATDDDEWRIAAIQGRVSWHGPNALLDPAHPTVRQAVLENPQWKPNGEFSAQARCVGGQGLPWTVDLKKISGKWNWFPKRACAQETPAP